MSLLDLVPTAWVMPAAGATVLVLSGLLGTQTWRLHSEQSAHAQEHAQIAEERLMALRAVALQDAADRAEKERRDAAQREALNVAEQAATQARADAALRDAAAGRLQQRISDLVAAARKAAASPTAVPSSAPAEDATGMLSDVLGRCIARVRLLADVADDRGRAGQLCERSYDALKETTE